MTAGRSARTSAEALTKAAAPDAQVARVSAEAIVQASSRNAQMARLSVEVLVANVVTDGPRWGIPWK